MKIIRPEYTPPKQQPKIEPPKEEKVDINALMQEIIDESKIAVTVRFTQKQHELWLKKGGEKWLKKALVGQVKRSKK